MDIEEIKKLKAEIDAMSQLQMCHLWRFAAVGSPYFQGELGNYFKEKLKERGGFTPEISKELG